MTSLLLPLIYLAFISLGLPDALLGSAWPSMYTELNVPLSSAGLISMIIAAGTVISSLMSERMTRRFGPGKVTAFSVGLTAVSLGGFALSGSYWQLCLLAVPYGLGAGSVDACLNNYMALHYTSRHMSWLHCMWGIGASVGPHIMGRAITAGQSWHAGYGYIAVLQIVLTFVLLMSLPIWKQRTESGEQSRPMAPVTLRQALFIRGVREVLTCFFCYCALEQTAGLWASSYLVLKNGLPAEKAASLAALYYMGLTVGRALGGFLTFRLNDRAMIRTGFVLILLGLVCIPLGGGATLAGLVIMGLGSAPIYPCLIHSTPGFFGAGNSQAIIGMQMASAYVGTCLMPPLFGLIAEALSVALYPLFLFVFLALMFISFEKLLKLYE